MTKPEAHPGNPPATLAAGLGGHDFRDDIMAVQSNASVPTMLETVCLATGLRFAAVARVNEERWITCSAIDHLQFGLAAGDELPVETTLCHELRRMRTEIIINDAACDEVYRDHHTPKMYGFRSYLSIPIHRPDGSFFGTLCALDPEPNKLDDIRVLKMGRLFAGMIGDSLQTREQLQTVEEELAEERRLAGIQERFMAILAHDLRNPVAAIRSGLRLLGRQTHEPQGADLIRLMDASAARMAGLVANLMDHARNRLGDGIVLHRVNDANLAETVQLIVSECRTMAPDRKIELFMNIPCPVSCDPARIAQLLSNLLGNAITHGAADRPIRVEAEVSDAVFRLRVANEGKPIPQEHIPNLFTPFNGHADGGHRAGLGLGLYIASEIAKAHGGAITLRSDPDQTVFTFDMPCP